MHSKEMFRQNLYWVFLTTPTNVWVSFKQIQNMTEIARINEGPKAIALVPYLIFYWYFKLVGN